VVYCIGAECPLGGLSFIVFGGLNMRLELFLSSGKRGNNVGLPEIMLDISVEFGKGV